MQYDSLHFLFLLGFINITPSIKLVLRHIPFFDPPAHADERKMIPAHLLISEKRAYLIVILETRRKKIRGIEGVPAILTTTRRSLR